MANVMIRCPETGEAVPTGIAMSFDDFQQTTMTNVTLGRCPACGKAHVWQGDEAFPDS